jgi:hypothetical protein
MRWLLDGPAASRAGRDLEVRVVNLDPGVEIDLLHAPGDPQTRIGPFGFPDRRPDASPGVGGVAKLELDEIAGSRTRVAGHAGEVGHRLRGPCQVGQRVNGADCAAEDATEVETRHVCEQRLAWRIPGEAFARQPHHLRRFVEADRLDAALGQRRRHPARTAGRLEDWRAIASQPLEEPVDLSRDIA